MQLSVPHPNPSLQVRRTTGSNYEFADFLRWSSAAPAVPGPVPKAISEKRGITTQATQESRAPLLPQTNSVRDQKLTLACRVVRLNRSPQSGCQHYFRAADGSDGGQQIH
jgi:hypothetical protein